jgi:hypothetical protein
MDKLKTHQALFVAAGLSLACGLATLVRYPEIVPFESLQRSSARANWVRPGPQFCGLPKGGRAIGHQPAAWVVELPLDGGVYCLIINPNSELQARQLANTSRETPLIALHTDDKVWQLEGPGGVLLPYQTRVQEVRSSLPGYWKVQAGFVGIAILLFGVGRTLKQRARQPRVEHSAASAR